MPRPRKTIKAAPPELAPEDIVTATPAQPAAPAAPDASDTLAAAAAPEAVPPVSEEQATVTASEAPAVNTSEPASETAAPATTVPTHDNAGKNISYEPFKAPKPYEPVDLPYKIYDMNNIMVMQAPESCRYTPEIEMQLLESHHVITLHGKRISKKSVEAMLPDEDDESENSDD